MKHIVNCPSVLISDHFVITSDVLSIGVIIYAVLSSDNI